MGSTVISGRANIDKYQTLVMRSALRLEIDTGLKRSSRGMSTLQLVNHKFDKDFKRKQAALDFLEEEVIAKWPENS